ncbi:MAG: PIN domain-containing protein [Candidatus Acidiferrum sp.]
MKLFVDTWGWLALADRNDAKHGPAADCYRERSRLSRHVVTSNFVLDELFTLVFLRLPFPEAAKFANAILASRAVTTEMVTRERFRTAMEFRLKFADKPKISFTDLTSMVIMKELGISEVLTADSHFAQVGMGFHILPE